MNILFILADALRPDHLGCYGYPKNTSPNIDRLAREGVRFECHIAVSSHTFPPVVSLFTGQSPAAHGLMSARDYAFWKQDPAWCRRRTPLRLLRDSGFDLDGERVLRWSPLGFDRDTEDLETYLEMKRNRPWFFLAAPYSTHLPYNPPRNYYEMFLDPDFQPGPDAMQRLEVVRTRMLVHPPGVVSALEAGQPDAIGQGKGAHRRSAGIVELAPGDRPGITALYDGEVRVLDDLVGRWIRRLDELDLLDPTLIVLTADHGEELLERGHVGHSSCNLHGTLFDECLRVPLILRLPSRLPQGLIIREQTSQIDVMPTILDLLDQPRPADLEGLSLLPLIKGRTQDFREEAYAQTVPAGWQALDDDRREEFCLRTPTWKLILSRSGPEQPDVWNLYDLQADPGERVDVSGREVERFRDMRARLETYVARASAHKHRFG